MIDLSPGTMTTFKARVLFIDTERVQGLQHVTVDNDVKVVFAHAPFLAIQHRFPFPVSIQFLMELAGLTKPPGHPLRWLKRKLRRWTQAFF